jgi:hypothetical protein
LKNSQLLPFERNRYYAGKVLTSTDFTAEQLYMNNKRRFLNSVMYGQGVICGLNVINLDDISVLVESGAAIDAAGREIVLESSVVKKLSSLEGYENLNGGKAFLCIRYREEEVHPVYRASADVQDGEKSEYEHNRIDEGYELYLVGSGNGTSPVFQMDDEFLYEKEFVDNEDYLMKLRIPAVVSKGEAVKIVFEVKKKTKNTDKLSFHASFQMPVFTSESGGHTLDVDWKNIEMEEGEILCRSYWVNAELTELEETSLLARREEIKVYQGKRPIEINEDIAIHLLLVDLSPEELATREIGKMNLEMRNVHQRNELLKLAEISFVQGGSSYLVQSIKEQGVKNYIATPGETYHRSKYLSYFKSQDNTRLQMPQSTLPESTSAALTKNQMQMTSGRMEIPLSVNMKKGEIAYSEEIMHGLGSGDVYVQVGLEYKDARLSGQSMPHTIYGDAGMFETAEVMEIDTAVKVMKERGSFQVAVRLKGEQKNIIVPLTWVAIKIETEKTEEDTYLGNGRIVPQHATVQLGMKNKYFFEVNFENMQPCPLSYELTERDSGEIGEDGVYQAPSKEGVYEIKIYCTDKPRIATYVYAIVNK